MILHGLVYVGKRCGEGCFWFVHCGHPVGRLSVEIGRIVFHSVRRENGRCDLLETCGVQRGTRFQGETMWTWG